MKSRHHFFLTDHLQQLLDQLHQAGYTCIGPQVRDGAIVYDPVTSVEQLPRGVNDEQAPGSYSLNRHPSAKYFDWANGPQAIKPYLFSAREKLWDSVRTEDGQLSFNSSEVTSKPIAFFGVRSCDIAAMKIQDQHFLQQVFVDPYYKSRREQLLLIAVNCSRPADTCFCHSTGDGPFLDETDKNGADIVLTELEQGFLIKTLTARGEKITSALKLTVKTDMHTAEAESLKNRASNQKRRLPRQDIQSTLLNKLNDNAWHDIATECLSCGNCTSVCPTCFCHSENEVPALDGQSSAHYREWDSCFSQGHSYIHGITIRSQTSQRYRQWLTHKFGSWHQQYGRSGCVGCGRCISWCPVGIDVIESLSLIVGSSNGQ
jgi:sulfhydrogenase subunit beta (sulfur reductase)